MNLFEIDDYKSAILNIIRSREKPERGLFRKMAEYLRVNPSLISQVISGSKDFTEEQIILVSEFLGLSKLESLYLLVLVQIARSGSVKLKSFHQEQLEEVRKKALNLSNRVQVPRTLSDNEKAKFYSSWIYSAIQLCTTLTTPPSFSAICTKFQLEPFEAQKIISFLLEMGMIVEEKGVYKSGTSITHLEKASPFVLNLHRNWRVKALQMIEKISEEELMYTCNFSVSKKDFSTIREEFVKMIQKFLVTAQASPAEDLAQFNLDLFWLRN